MMNSNAWLASILSWVSQEPRRKGLKRRKSGRAGSTIEALEDRSLLSVTALGTPLSQYTNSSTVASYTVASGTDRLLVVAVGDPASFTSPTAVSFNGTPMLQGNATNDGAISSDGIWYLKLGSGAAVSGPISVTFVGADNRFIGASAYAGVDQTTPVDVNGPKISGAVTGIDIGSSLNVTSQTGDLVFDLGDFYRTASVSTVTTGPGQTRINDGSGIIVGGGNAHYVTSTEAGAGTVTMSWTTGAGTGAGAVLHLAMNINQSVAVAGATGTVQFTTSTKSVTEGNGSQTVTVSLTGTGTLAQSVTVPVSATNGTANSGSDYTLVTTSVTFPAGTILSTNPTQTVTFNVIDDTDVEASQNLTINLGTITAPGDTITAGSTTTNTVTIADNDTDVLVTKTDSVTTAVPGSSTTYTIVVSNSASGSVTASGTTFTDNFPAGVTSATWTSVAAGGATGNTASSSGNISQTLSLPPGSSVTYTVTANIAATATGSLVNTATVSQASDVNGGNNSATDTDTLTPQTNVSVTKTDGVTSVIPGSATTYTIVVSNSGPSVATSTSLTDNFPAEITSAIWTSVAAGGATGNTASSSGNISETLSLPAGASVTYTVTANVSGGATGSLVNTATVSQAFDTTPGNNSATDTDSISQQTNVSVTKTDGVTSVTSGTSTTYTIVVSNSGPSIATGTTLTDVFPSGITSASWTSVAAGGATGNTLSSSGNISETLNLPAGSSVTYTVTAQVSPAATGSLVNTATVSHTDDANSSDNSATDTDTLTQLTNVSVTKSDGVTSVTAGTSTTYTIVVSNSGPSTALATSLTDVFPSEITSATWTSVAAGGATGNTASSSGNISETLNLPVGANVTYTVTANISSGASGSLVNTATVAQASDSSPGNNSATDTDSIIALNIAPTATAPVAHYSATEQVILSLKNTGLLVSDVDSGGGAESLLITVGQGVLNVTAGTSGATVADSGTAAVTITGTIAQINALLNTDGASTISYINPSDSPNASTLLSLTINDNGNSGAGGPLTGSASTTIDITAVDDAPVAYDGILNAAQNIAQPGTLIVTDGDTPVPLLTISVVTGPSHGSVVINDVHTGAYTYTPMAGYLGPDSFTFKANDGSLNSNTATISVNVATVVPFIVDNADPGYSETGSWKNKTTTGPAGYLGNLRYAHPSATTYSAYAYDNGVRVANPGDVEFAKADDDTAVFTFTGLQAGSYQVAVTYKAATNRATNASFTVSGTGAGNQTVTINQQLAPSSFTTGVPSSVGWQTLVSSYGTISANGTLTVTLTSAGANGYVIADAVRIVRVNPSTLEAAGGAASQPVTQSLSNAELQRVAQAAISRWQAAPITSAQKAALTNLKFEVSDLGNATLGTQSGSTITIDNNAAGHGWFVDTTPNSDSEFSIDNGQQLRAKAGTGATDRIDLLTVVLHELGHKLGLDDLFGDGDSVNLMFDTLSVGTRRLPPKPVSQPQTAKAKGHGNRVKHGR